MDPGVVTNGLAVVVSTVTVGVSVFFALRQIRTAQRANHTLVAIELLTRDRMSETFLTSQEYVLYELAAAAPGEVPVSGLPPEARKHVSRLAVYYNGLGQMLAFEVVDPVLLIGTVDFRARQAWAALEPYIRAERALRGESSYLSNFEHLVATATERPRDEAVRKLKMRRAVPRQSADDLAGVEKVERVEGPLDGDLHGQHPG